MEDIPEGKHFSFPKSEERTLEFWDQIDAFNEQLRRTEGQPEYTFYDGPPFATGLPHYGHILAGTLKVREMSDDRPIGRRVRALRRRRPTLVAVRPLRLLTHRRFLALSKQNRTSSRATPP